MAERENWKSKVVSSIFDLTELFSVGRTIMRGAWGRVTAWAIADRLDVMFASSNAVTIVDVGAFRGEWSRQVATVLPVRRCILIEPHPNSYQCLMESKSSLPAGALFLNVAVAEADHGNEMLYLTKNPVGTSLRAPEPGWLHEWTHVEQSREIKTRRLDSLLDEYGFHRVDILKVDAQGCDLEVLRSAGDFLRPDRIASVVVELNFRTFYSGQQPWWATVALLQERGYQVSALEQHFDSAGLIHWADALFVGEGA